jgi:hypothetical protein
MFENRHGKALFEVLEETRELRRIGEQILKLLRAPVRIQLDIAHAVKTPQPIPPQKGLPTKEIRPCPILS